MPVDPIAGRRPGQGAGDRRPGQHPGRGARPGRCGDRFELWEVFVGEEATLVEVNPLVRTPDDQILALDGKVTLDDNADFRHAAATPRYRDTPPPTRLRSAKEIDLNYVKLDG